MGTPTPDRFSIKKASPAFKAGYADGFNRNPSTRSYEDWNDETADYCKGYCLGRAQHPLSGADIDAAIRRACGCLGWTSHYDSERGMSDEELEAFLKAHMSEGGSGGPDSMAISYNANGLKVWASWSSVVPREPHELVSGGSDTRDRARRVFGIRNPDDRQISLFDVT